MKKHTQAAARRWQGNIRGGLIRAQRLSAKRRSEIARMGGLKTQKLAKDRLRDEARKQVLEAMRLEAFDNNQASD